MPNINHRSYSPKGLALTQQFEGLRLAAYQDSVGVWTIGYGHTGAEVHHGLSITQERATELLMQDVASAVAHVNRLVTIELTQNQFDALVDFVFNAGPGNFASSTLLRKLNAKDFQGAAAEFRRWCHAGKIELPGLVKRREAEMALFQLVEAKTATKP
jgi:lysozyme